VTSYDMNASPSPEAVGELLDWIDNGPARVVELTFEGDPEADAVMASEWARRYGPERGTRE